MYKLRIMYTWICIPSKFVYILPLPHAHTHTHTHRYIIRFRRESQMASEAAYYFTQMVWFT